MTEALVRLERRARGAVWLTLDRPEIHNAFDDRLIAELTRELEALGGDDGVRVLVLTGHGRSFSAGADLNWMRRTAGYGEAENLADLLDRLYERRLPDRTLRDEREDARRGGALEVRGDRLRVVRAPALDPFDDHEPCALVPEEPERVAGRDRFCRRSRVGGEELHALGREAAPQPREGAADLGAVAAEEEVGGAKLVGGHGASIVSRPPGR